MPAKRRETAAAPVPAPSRSPGGAAPAPRIYYLHHRMTRGWEGLASHLDRALLLGFDTVLLSPVFETEAGADVFLTTDHRQIARSIAPDQSLAQALTALSAACGQRGLRLFLDLVLDRLSVHHGLVQAQPSAFTLRRGVQGRGPIDPRQPQPLNGEAFFRLGDPTAAKLMQNLAAGLIGDGVAAGVSGFRLLQLGAGSPNVWRGLVQLARSVSNERVYLVAETEGLTKSAAQGLVDCGFDAFTANVGAWSLNDPWRIEGYEDLRRSIPLIAVVEAPFGPRSTEGAAGVIAQLRAKQILELAPTTGSGLLVPMGFEFGAAERLDRRGGDLARFEEGFQTSPPLAGDLQRANRRTTELTTFSGGLRRLSGSRSSVTAFLRETTADRSTAAEALLILINPSLTEPATPDPDRLLAGCAFGPFAALDDGADPFTPMAPGAVRLARGKRTPAIITSAPSEHSVETAAKAPRLVVESLSPTVAGGAFAVKGTINQTVTVEADVLADGHESLAVELQWRAVDDWRWTSSRMSLVENDRWRGSFRPERLGRHEFRVEAWIDRFGGFRTDYAKKIDADVATDLDLKEGLLLIEAAAKRAKADLKKALSALLAGAKTAPEAGRRRLVLAPETLELMARADDRPFRETSALQRLDAERMTARFASWYELFPRSQSVDSKRHGRFEDVIDRLPAVADMGFDVLYFPPIHPIGRTNRKGPNNTLTAGPDDPGSPYAIGSEDGGHDAIHPSLGSLEDFRRLVRAAADAGLEIALDFAIQCSPDHPWLKEHPDWFAWRPDGTIRYAENPPKKYEDIVNVDFYGLGAVPGLWTALRDVVLLWVTEGVRIFRVDNPHTKPLPFWEWLIEDVRRAHPDVIFLAEAFTRPKMMYRLAKIGFSQSYTYFTWRHSKEEFTEYLTELTQGPPKDFFRPHFFVNTPDINPYFLQTSGRAGFLIRAALAATLSGLWGIYSGFELLEADPLPGKEEYLDSEKFQIKPRDWTQSGNIIAEIAQLNRIRKAHPALQTHLGVEFLGVDNPNVLYFAKAVPDADEMILVAINLDPHHGQDCRIEAPFWRLGLEENDPIAVTNLLAGDQFVWRGRQHPLWLDTGLPYLLLHIQAERPR